MKKNAVQLDIRTMVCQREQAARRWGARGGAAPGHRPLPAGQRLRMPASTRVGQHACRPAPTSLGTKSPASMKALARLPAGVPAATSARSRSPTEMWYRPYCKELGLAGRRGVITKTQKKVELGGPLRAD